VADLVQIEPHVPELPVTCPSVHDASRRVVWLQSITLGWMLVEFGVSLYGAISAHSSALLAFGADSFVELLSGIVVLMVVVPSFQLTKDHAARLTGILLFVLAGIVVVVTCLALASGVTPETSRSGIAVAIAALVVMPILAWTKRRIALQTNNRALAADAVQSATCAYLAAVTLAGLVINAVWHIHWVDSAAALVAVPILIVEGRHALRGKSCGCC
jgi:divalent metal cation (Fe/Co/Zn/Cd) transporter